ncbi:hypothetical protein PVAP13_2NG075346 [Panicum virgatum]|uniref:Uncharacterized protein n=1 Tax=Panicum virgatum TaxID=38727 RepID=A0A8T0VD47_PANVG|nr:hypothetical protein PVAP13_2NG075346 [Panicum virgatum]
MGTRVGIGLYTGNLLSSANGAKKPTKLSKWCQLMRQKVLPCAAASYALI